MSCRQEVVDAIPCRRPHADCSGQWPVVSGQHIASDHWRL